MKHVFSNGKTLEVREIGEVIFRMELRDENMPLPIIAKEIQSDEEARALLKNLKETGYYTAVDPKKTEKRDF